MRRGCSPPGRGLACGRHARCRAGAGIRRCFPIWGNRFGIMSGHGRFFHFRDEQPNADSDHECYKWGSGYSHGLLGEFVMMPDNWPKIPRPWKDGVSPTAVLSEPSHQASVRLSAKHMDIPQRSIPVTTNLLRDRAARPEGRTAPPLLSRTSAINASRLSAKQWNRQKDEPQESGA